MYVRAAQTLDEFENEKTSNEPFYFGSSRDRLIIPGSSLRGMLRNLVEVVSQSRLNPVTDKQLFYRSVEDTSMGDTYRDRMKDKVRAGFYHENRSGSWISPALAVRVPRKKIQEIFKVHSLYKDERPASPKRTPLNELQYKKVFTVIASGATAHPERFDRVESLSRSQEAGLTEGILVITGDMQNKKNEFVFVENTAAKTIALPDEKVALFEDKDQITQYQRYAYPGGKRGKGGLADGMPVFYLLDESGEEVVGFGRAYMFRLPYKLSPAEMLPEESKEDLKKYDMAESLFGYVPQKKNEERKQVAGRISITDAVMQGNCEAALLPKMQLKVLSSPKPTSFQNYLTQKNPNVLRNLYHYDTDKNTTTLRGHKFYWHKGPVDVNQIRATDDEIQKQKDQLSPAIKPIKEGQIFRFEISFQNLLPEELGAILWVLDIAADKQYRLKIGMGKPDGLGSVSISSEVILENRKQRYESLFAEKQWAAPVDGKVKEKTKLAQTAYAHWLLQKPDADINDVADLNRIQELLIMLSWEGRPAPDDTRYMELLEFAGRKGDFTKRSVLPSPFGVWNKNKK
jgi:CRISPR-associated protein (TIGR03986 family)